MIANVSNVSLKEGYDKSVEIRGIYKDYVILSLKNLRILKKNMLCIISKQRK